MRMISARRSFGQSGEQPIARSADRPGHLGNTASTAAAANNPTTRLDNANATDARSRHRACFVRAFLELRSQPQIGRVGQRLSPHDSRRYVPHPFGDASQVAALGAAGDMRPERIVPLSAPYSVADCSFVRARCDAHPSHPAHRVGAKPRSLSFSASRARALLSNTLTLQTLTPMTSAISSCVKPST